MTLLARLALGAELTHAGGRPARVRTLLIALGVAVGVAALLGAASIPSLLSHRDERERRQGFQPASGPPAATDLLVAQRGLGSTRGDVISGLDLRPRGAGAPVPAGVPRLPGPGEAFVSPRLAAVLRAEPATAEQLDARVVGTIADDGLVDRRDLRYYRGKRVPFTSEDAAMRITAFGDPTPAPPLNPLAVLLGVVAVAGLLAPVGAFVAAAVRFGGEGRDRRLAAVRLLGADRVTTRWIAAGEALVGATGGLVAGAGLFVVLRAQVDRFTLQDVSVFAADVDPAPALVALVVVGVPAMAVALTLLALRGVVVEPLGVSRQTRPARRRLAWRLAPPVLGVVLLEPLWARGADDIGQWRAAIGVLCVLLGVTAVLPWVVERAVARLDGGPVAWELARRRLLADPGSATRAVSGVAVAVAAAVALQSLALAVDRESSSDRVDVGPGPQVEVLQRDGDVAAGGRLATALAGLPGVRSAAASASGRVRLPGAVRTRQVTVAPCAALRAVARCRDGQAFLLGRGKLGRLRPGAALALSAGDGRTTALRLPGDVRAVRRGSVLAAGYAQRGLVLTPGALPPGAVRGLDGDVEVVLRDGGDEAAVAAVRDVATREIPSAQVVDLAAPAVAAQFRGVRRAISAGAVLVLVVMGAGLLIGVLEALRERRRVLAVLSAFGTRPRTLRASVLWQVGVPVALGLVAAVATGLGLGWLMTRDVGDGLDVDWGGVAALAGAGVAVVLGVATLTLPALGRLSRPAGLRTE